MNERTNDFGSRKAIDKIKAEAVENFRDESVFDLMLLFIVFIFLADWPEQKERTA